MALGVVLYPESGGGAVSSVYRREAGKVEELVMGLRPHGEAQGGGHQGGAAEARTGRPRWGVGVPHPLPPLGRTAGREDAPDVDVRWPVEPGPRVAGGAAGQRDLESRRPSAAAEAQRDGGGKTHTV